MNEIPISKELHGAGELLEKVADDNFIETTGRRHGILLDHIPKCWVIGEPVPLLDEIREISELTVFHHQVYMRRGFSAVYQSDDMGMVQAFQDLDLAVEVVLEFLVEFGKVD